MHLFAAIVPPPEILEELRTTVAAVSPRQGEAASQDARPPKSHRKEPTSRLRQLLRRSSAPPAASGHDQLDQLAVEQMSIPVTQFGNLTTADSVRLVEELRREAGTWPAPTLRFRGGAALEWPGDLGVWARIDGDVEALQTIGRAVPPIAQRLSLFVDRRMFRAWLQVGTITDETSAPYLEDLVAALDRFSGSTWEQRHLTLFRGKPNDEEGFEEVEQLVLGAPSRG